MTKYLIIIVIVLLPFTSYAAERDCTLETLPSSEKKRLGKKIEQIQDLTLKFAAPLIKECEELEKENNRRSQLINEYYKIWIDEDQIIHRDSKKSNIKLGWVVISDGKVVLISDADNKMQLDFNPNGGFAVVTVYLGSHIGDGYYPVSNIISYKMRKPTWPTK